MALIFKYVIAKQQQNKYAILIFVKRYTWIIQSTGYLQSVYVF
jgi:hypothetical protein